MTKVVGISAAHHPRRSGADFCGFCEHNESRIWTKLVKEALEKAGVEVHEAPIGGLRNKVDWLNLRKPDVSLEIHFNGSLNPQVQGCETLYHPGSKLGFILAKLVHKAYQPEMDNNDRGVKEGWYRMDRPMVIDYPGDVDGDEKPDYFLAKTNCPALILEPDFIAQVRNITDKRYAACEKIAAGILTYLETLDG